jgi:hypothetical protein
VDLNPINLFDRHGWIPTVFFGFVNWFKKPPEKGECLSYRIGSSVLLSSSRVSKLKSTWEGREITHLQIFVLFFSSKGSALIRDRNVLVECVDGEILDAELRNIPDNENWTLQWDSKKATIPIGILKPSEEFSLVLFMQNGSKEAFKLGSRSELKVQDGGLNWDFSSHRSGYQHGWMTCISGVVGCYALEAAKHIEAHPFPDVMFQTYAPLILKLTGWLAVANALLGYALNVWYEDWKTFKNKKTKITKE